jgi:hypothetical protein
MKFNINQDVRVQLNDTGRAIVKEYHDKIFKSMKKDFPFRPKKEDANGYSTWQLWDLMATFGPHISMAKNPPFDLEIEIKN